MDFLIFTHASSLEALAEASDYAPGLQKLLSPGEGGGLSGALVLYVAPPEMWKATVQLLAESESCDSEAPAAALRRRCAWAERRLSGAGSDSGGSGPFRRVRVLAPGDFGPTLRAVRARLGEDLRHWLQKSSYDSPKFLEATVRLELLGSSVCVLRMDEDVLFNHQTLEDGMAGVKRLVEALVEQWRRNGSIQVLSGQYVFKSATKDRRSFGFWNGAFTARGSPALLATQALCRSERPPLEAELDEAVDEELMTSFFEALPGGSSSKSSDRLASGAGLCSGGAALDLPPWCHLRQNVLWIDDQCLCQLVALESSRPESARCFALEVEVTKGRRPPASFVWHTLEVYLPSLLYGLVMRAWIDGPLAPALRWVRYYGRPLPLSRRQRLECQLWEEALQCCSAWRLHWARLRGSCGPSFAALWATGEVQRHPLLGPRCSADSSARSPRSLRLGRGLVTADAPDKLRKADLNEFLLEALGELIQDALQHLNWVLLWPSVVQAVRHTPPLRSGGFFERTRAETWRSRL